MAIKLIIPIATNADMVGLALSNNQKNKKAEIAPINRAIDIFFPILAVLLPPECETLLFSFKNHSLHL